MQIRNSKSSSIEGVELCSERVNQLNTSMIIQNRSLEILTQNHCLRPESMRNSHYHYSILSNQKPNLLNLYPYVMNQPPDTENEHNNTITNGSINSNTILN